MRANVKLRFQAGSKGQKGDAGDNGIVMSINGKSSADVVLDAADIGIATEEQAEAGADNAEIMTALRTKQQIDGRLADEPTAEAGADNVDLMTSLRTRQSVIANGKDALLTDMLPFPGYIARTVLERLGELVSLKDFAKGDGTTDDTSGLQKAINVAAGGVLFAPAGIYRLAAARATAAVTIPAEGVTIMGAGKYVTTFVLANTIDCAMFAAIDANRVEFSDIGFDGESTSRLAWQRALVLRGVEDVTIRDCRFHRIGDGGVLFGRQGLGGSDAYGEGTRQPKRIMVHGCEWSACWGTVALLSKYTGMSDVQITNNRFRDSCSVAISIESEDGNPATEISVRTIVTGNIVTGCSYAYAGGLSSIAWGISLGELVDGVICAHNIVDGVTGSNAAAGILVSTSPSQTDQLTKTMLVQANQIRNVDGGTGRGFGVLVQAGETSVETVSVDDNMISLCRVGIGLEAGAGAKTLGTIKGLSVEGNKITDCSEFGIWSANVSGSGELALLDAIIGRNTVLRSGSHGIAVKMTGGGLSHNVVQGNTGDGISLQSGSAGVEISSNSARANGGSGLTLAGDDLQIVANRSRNNGQAGATSYGIYVVSGARAEIIANDCGDDQGSPTQDYGVRAPNGSTVRNNKLIGNATGANWNGIANHNTGTYDAGLNRTA